ncbi:cysteine desulfurase [Candidatus Woesearchaeota archaeon]|nr:cysteine desulfurase [Candidatus Woesearchaeota archaeon]
MEIYLDNAATTRVDQKVVEAMLPFFLETYGNAHSMHQAGKKVMEAVEKAREVLARKIQANPGELFFTSGGTEGNNLAIKGILQANKDKGNHIITSAIEHASILETCKALQKEGYKVTFLPVDPEGFVNLEQLRNAITEKTLLVSIMHANNEIGTIQDIAEMGRICREKNILFHTDAVQSFCKEEIEVEEMNIDLLSISGHKIHGPKGIGALYRRQGIKITPLLRGGEQEQQIRSGTLNVPAIVGFSKAIEVFSETDIEWMQQLRDMLLQSILENIPFTKLNGSREKRLCNNANVAFEYVEADSLLTQLDSHGIRVSTGSACESYSLEPSHVLQAIGLSPELAHGTLRFSLSKYTTREEIHYTIQKLMEIVDSLRKVNALVG